MEKQIQVWDVDSAETLKVCFECTSRNVFEDSSADLDEMTEVISGYTDFYVGVVISAKTSRVYPNDKPWVTKGLKEVLNQKKTVFAPGSLQDRKEIQRKVNKENKTKCQYSVPLPRATLGLHGLA